MKQKRLYPIVLASTLVIVQTFNASSHFTNQEYTNLMSIDDNNAYAILGVNSNASTRQIKKAYRQLARKYHPDRNPNTIQRANQAFKKILEAYNLLCPSQQSIDEFSLDKLMTDFFYIGDFFGYVGVNIESQKAQRQENLFFNLFLEDKYIHNNQTILHYYHNSPDIKKDHTPIIQLDVLLAKKRMHALRSDIIENCINAVNNEGKTYLYHLLETNNKTIKDFHALFEIFSKTNISVDVNTHPQDGPMPIELLLNLTSTELRSIADNAKLINPKATEASVQEHLIKRFEDHGLNQKSQAYLASWRFGFQVKSIAFSVSIIIGIFLLLVFSYDIFMNEAKMSKAIWHTIKGTKDMKANKKDLSEENTSVKDTKVSTKTKETPPTTNTPLLSATKA